MGFSVTLYDIVHETILAVQKKGGIELRGAVNGFGRLALATTRMDEAVSGADLVVVVTPAIAHRAIAEQCAPLLEDGQVVFLHPGATGGALEFRKVLADCNCRAEVAVGESNSLIYACRSPQPAAADIFAVKNHLLAAALPATGTRRLLGQLNRAFPQIRAARNVLETSLGNPNAMMHPAPTLLNTSVIESGNDWLYYWDGITPSIGDFVEAMDRERLALAARFGLDLPSIREWYRISYGATGRNLTEIVRDTKAYAGVKGQKSLRTRYLLEDVPTGLVPMVALGRLAGTEIGRMESVVHWAEFLLGEDFSRSGRNVEALGLSGMKAADITRFVETGS
jgi:opine dehydrogenase